MDRYNLNQPLNEIKEEDVEESILYETNLNLNMSKTGTNSISETKNNLSFEIPHQNASIIGGNLFSHKKLNDGPDDVQSSFIKQTNSAIERMRHSYRYSDDQSNDKDSSN